MTQGAISNVESLNTQMSPAFCVSLAPPFRRRSMVPARRTGGCDTHVHSASPSLSWFLIFRFFFNSKRLLFKNLFFSPFKRKLSPSTKNNYIHTGLRLAARHFNPLHCRLLILTEVLSFRLSRRICRFCTTFTRGGI